MGTEAAKAFAKFAVKTKLEDIPAPTLEFVKGLMLKTVAGMIVGSGMPVGKLVHKATKERKHPDEVGVVGGRYKTSLWNAVLNCGIFAHAAELEDDSFMRGTAWDITTFPIYFPLAEKMKMTGKELLEVCAVGLEVHSRTTLFFPQGHLGLTVIPGAMGPAAGVAKALGLNVEQTVNALGLAMSGVPVAYVSFGTDAHYTETALQCFQALVAGELAKKGLVSNPDIVTYMTNIIGKERVIPEKFTENLGREWRVHDIWIKKYPCCFHMHRYLDAFWELIRDEDLSYDQVKKIDVHISKVEEVCNRPDPKSFGDLQFSFQNAMSAMLLDRDVNFSHVAEDKIGNAQYKEARTKVGVIFHPEWVPRYAMETPAIVDVTLKNGKQFTRKRMHTIGSPKEPLPGERFRELFLKFTKGRMAKDKLQWTADALTEIEALNRKEMANLMEVLVYGCKA